MPEGINCDYEYSIEYLFCDGKTYTRSIRYNTFEKHDYTKAVEVYNQAKKDNPETVYKLFMYNTRIIKEALEF